MGEGPAGTPLFGFARVRVDGGDRPRLDLPELAIPSGGITVLSGPSGAGKSTLLRLCNRLDVPDAGTVTYRGRPLDELDPRALRREVAMVFQRPTLFAGTVADNLRVAAPDADRATMAEALRRADLEPEFLDRTGDDLSGGEAQRACLARALLTEPAVLLLDEPTSALDQASVVRLEATIRSLVDEGRSAVWVSHDAAQIERVADHVVCLEAGRVLEVRHGGGPPC